MLSAVAALERRGWGRGKAALFVCGVITLIVFVIIVWAATPVWQAVAKFVDDVPGYVNEARNSDALKGIDKNSDAFKKLEGTLADAAKQFPSDAENLLGAAASALGNVFSLVTLGFLTLFGVIAKPALTRSAGDLMSSGPAARFEHTLDEVSRTISFSLMGNVVISVIAGAVVGVAAPAP